MSTIMTKARRDISDTQVPSADTFTPVVADVTAALALTGEFAAALTAISESEDMAGAVTAAMSLYRADAGDAAVAAGQALVKVGNAARDAHANYRVGIVGAIITRQPGITDHDLAETMYGAGSYKNSIKVMVLRDRALVEVLSASAAYNLSHKGDKAVERITLPEARKAISNMNKADRAVLVGRITEQGVAAIRTQRPQHKVASVIAAARRLADMLADMERATPEETAQLRALLGRIVAADVTGSRAA